MKQFIYYFCITFHHLTPKLKIHQITGNTIILLTTRTTCLQPKETVTQSTEIPSGVHLLTIIQTQPPFGNAINHPDSIREQYKITDDKKQPYKPCY